MSAEKSQNDPERNKGGRHRKGAVRVAAAALAAGLTVKAAAERSGVGRQTLIRWRKTEKFQDLVAGLQDEMVGRAVGVLARHMGRAAAKLAALLNSEDEATVLRAATKLLEIGFRSAGDMKELQEQVSELMKRLPAEYSR